MGHAGGIVGSADMEQKCMSRHPKYRKLVNVYIKFYRYGEFIYGVSDMIP
jgi:hypothetical protein